jgi:ATP-binding protein involved in chromosome partitioning
MQRMEKGDIDHIVVIGSGKGGVGKSTVTSLIATSLRRRGLSVGVLDADITGASIPKLFGVKGPLLDRGEGIVPAVSADDPTPVVWRGPLVTRLILQFFGGVNWGHLDYLLIDMPPGTSDVPLTVFQSIPIEGMVFVLTPQELSSLIVRKAMNMARELHVPLLGLVENMAYFVCPHCQKETELFGPSAVPAVVKEYGIPLLGRLPIEPTISTLGDSGRVREFDSDALRAVTDAFLTTVKSVARPATL